MTIANDAWIRKMAKEHGMITPFEEGLVSKGKISFGVSSYGYDVRVGSHYKIFHNLNSTLVDPKAFDSKSFVDHDGSECIIPPNSFVLAETVERFRIPREVLCVCLGKSTYARCFTGDTRVALVDGSAPTLEEMAERAGKGETFFGYAVGEHGRIVVTLLDLPRWIARDSVLELTLDSGERIRCTHDHVFLRRDGTTSPAHDLRPGDSLMPLDRERTGGCESVYEPQEGRLIPTRRLADEWKARNGIHDDLPGTRRRPARSVGAPRAFATRIPTDSAFVAAGGRLREGPIASRDAARNALDATGSTRGAARSLGDDRTVFRRAPDAEPAARGGSYQGAASRRVLASRELPGEHDVFCLTVPEAGNFALDAGVFVRNCGIIVNVTPLEPEWEGVVTIEISNTTPLPAKIYSNEGIAQILFLRAAPDGICETSYADRKGKYQSQKGLTLPKVL